MSTDAMPTRLSNWSQMAPRVYVRVALCFELVDDDHKRIIDHLKASLLRLGNDHPDLAGELRTYPWFDSSAVWLQNGKPGQMIRLDVHEVEADNKDFAGIESFADLEREGFAAARFVGKTMGVPLEQVGNQPIPVVVVRALFIKGGLTLAIYFHHTFGDGKAMDTFLRCFSAATRGEKEERPTKYVLDLPKQQSDGTFFIGPNEIGIIHRHTFPPGTWEKQLSIAPELKLLDAINVHGPAQPIQFPGGTPMDKIGVAGKVFVISHEAIARLKRLIVDNTAASAHQPNQAASNGTGGTTVKASNGTNGVQEAANEATSNGANGDHNEMAKRHIPSTFMALAAVVWAHMTEARHQTSAHNAPPEALGQHARLLTPIDWRRRAFPDLMANYFGNAVLQASTEVSVDELRVASGQTLDKDDEEESDVGPEVIEADADAALARLVAKIEATIHGIDDVVIRRRTELFDAISDPRKVGLAIDSRAPQNLHFNTWRRFGGNTLWQFGDGRAPIEPATIRRIQAAWNLGGALILPARSDDAPYEICITMETEAMEALCVDKRWMRWVDRVVG